jgi:hypothetical protein
VLVTKAKRTQEHKDTPDGETKALKEIAAKLKDFPVLCLSAVQGVNLVRIVTVKQGEYPSRINQHAYRALTKSQWNIVN